MDEKAIALLQTLADKIGTTVEMLYNTLCTIAIREGFLRLAMTLVVAVCVTFVSFYILRKALKLHETDDLPDWLIGVSIIVMMLDVVFFCIVISDIHKGLSMLINPEYFALQNLFTLR